MLFFSLQKESKIRTLDQSNKVTVITGTAGGIGRQIAYTFASNGSNIALLDINEKEGQKVISDIEEKYKIKGLFIPCNITNYEKVKKASNEIVKRFKRVDNLVTAADMAQSPY